MVSDTCEVQVIAPTSIVKAEIDLFVSSKQSWIEKMLAKQRQRVLFHYSLEKLRKDDRQEVWYLGKTYPLCLQDFEKKSVVFKEGAVQIMGSNLTDKQVVVLFNKWMKHRSEEIIGDRVLYWSHQMGLYPRTIRFRNMKSRWGSCSSHKSVSLSIGLLSLDLALIDYVVIHELAHLKHMNHGSRFWTLVEQYCPQMRALRKELQLFSPELRFD
tara:strand:- start:47 stop:685 length:639 start_codon:yes stop_codon:yes gene_type:complete